MIKNEPHYKQVDRVLVSWIDAETRSSPWTMTDLLEKLDLLMNLVPDIKDRKVSLHYARSECRIHGTVSWSDQSDYEPPIHTYTVVINQTTNTLPVETPESVTRTRVARPPSAVEEQRS